MMQQYPILFLYMQIKNTFPHNNVDALKFAQFVLILYLSSRVLLYIYANGKIKTSQLYI